MAELGLVGNGPNSYQRIFCVELSGLEEHPIKCPSLAKTFMNKVKLQDLEKVFDPLFYYWRRKQQSKESFGDFTNRMGFEKLQELVDKWDSPPQSSARYNLKVFAGKETYEAVDELARIQDKNAHQLSMEIIRDFIASQQNGKHE